MSFTVKDWRNATTYAGGGDESTPLSAEALEDLEERVTDYADTVSSTDLSGTFNIVAYGAVGDGVTDDTAEIQAAIDDCDAGGGGVVYFPPGDYVFTTLSLASMNNVRLVGAGTQAVIVRSSTTTGNLFDFTGASFCTVEDLSFAANAERTAGAVFYLDAGAGSCQRNEFRRLRMHGGYRLWHLDDCTTTTIDEIQVADYDSSHDWHSMIHLGGASVSTIASNIRGGTGASVANAFVYIDGPTVDTVQFRNFDVLSHSPSTGMNCVMIASGQWIKFTDCSFESGTTGYAVIANAGRGVDFTACHLLGVNGMSINAGTAIRVLGGEVLVCQQHGINLSGGTHHEFIGVTFSDISQQTTATYSGINIAAGVTDFTIRDCAFGNMYGSGSGNTMATAIALASGASNRYVIRDNRIATTGVGTPMDDGGTGTDKVIEGNVWTGSGFASAASAATLNPNQTLANAHTISVTGSTTITSVTASAKGRVIRLVWASGATFDVTDGSNLKLSASITTFDADDTLTLVCDGTNWIETGRSTN